MRDYFFAISRLTVLLTRRYFRNRTAIFFSIFFPLIFLFIFGGLFGKSNNTSFKVAVINDSHTAFSQQFVSMIDKSSIFKVQPGITNLDDAKEKMNQSQLDSIIQLPPTFGQPGANHLPSGQVNVFYSDSSPQTGQTVASVIQSILSGVNAKLTGISPPLTVASQSTSQNGLTSFDYIFSGLLGFSILGLGIFGPVNTLPAEKNTGALTRLRVTPLRPSQFIISYMLSSLLTGVLSITCMFLIATTLFHFHMEGNYLVFILYALLGAITIFGIGVGVGGWAKNVRAAAPLSNIVSFPMMFLSGTFFPRYLMPEWLQHISAFLPLTPIVDGLRMILTEGKTFTDLGPQLALLAVWTIIIYTAAFRVFSWD